MPTAGHWPAEIKETPANVVMTSMQAGGMPPCSPQAADADGLTPTTSLHHPFHPPQAEKVPASAMPVRLVSAIRMIRAKRPYPLTGVAGELTGSRPPGTREYSEQRADALLNQ